MYVITGSSTTAMRLKKAVERTVGYPADVVHTPSALNKGGCSYSVKIDDRAVDEAIKVAKNLGIKIKGLYMEEIVKGERVYHVIS